MKKIIKKRITKGFLLFLFTFFCVGMQGQYTENGQNHWSATAVGQLIANALTTSDSWKSAQSFFVKDQEGNFVRIDFALDNVVVSRNSGSGNFKISDEEEKLFDELKVLEELTPEELDEAKATVQIKPNCPKWYVWDGEKCVKIPEEERRPCEKATLADHCYNTKNNVIQAGAPPLPQGTTLVSTSLLPKDKENKDLVLSNTTSGFNSALYKVDNGDGKIEYVYATQGTDMTSPVDWINNVAQGVGNVSEQYAQSIKNAQALKKWAEDNHYTLSFTGHSLGGGMANANALATGLKATIYNPAGLSNGTIKTVDYKLDLGNSKNVTAYTNRGEILNTINLITDNPVRGTIHYVGSALIPVVTEGSGRILNVVKGALLPGGVVLAGYLHTMGAVFSNLDCND